MPPALPMEGSHSSGAPRNLDLVLSSPVRAITGTVAISGAAPVPFTVVPGTSTRIPLGSTADGSYANAVAPAYNTPSNVGAFVVADSPDLTVDHREVFDQEQSSETIKADTVALGTRFRLGGYSLNREGRPDTGIDSVLIYAPTAATVTLSAPPGATAPFWSGQPGLSASIPLSAGQTVAVRTVVGVDFDGALLTSTAPVAASAGGRGWSAGACGDDGMDGLIPMDKLGREYVLRLPTASTTTGVESRARVIADVDGTVVRVNGATVATLAAGELYTFQPTMLSYVETTQNALVWMNGSLNGCEVDTVLIPPVQFAPAVSELSLDFNVIESTQTPAAEMSVLIASSALSTIRLDGAALAPPVDAVVVPGRADLTYVRFDLPQGDHNVTAASDFQAMLASRTQPSGLLAFYNPYRIPGCGDGAVDTGEQCDDGDASDGDGCSSACQLEPGWICNAAEPSVCVTACGNGSVGGGETCDDGNVTAGDGCNATCRREVAITAPSAGSVTRSNMPTVTGSADPGASVMIMVEGQTATVTADGMGAWSFMPSLPLADGARAVTAIATDTAGGVSMATSSFTVDSSTMVSISAPSSGAQLREERPIIRGTGEIGAQITILIDMAPVGLVSVGADGTWSYPTEAPLAAGPHTVSATASDAAGNTASTPAVPFTLDSATMVSITTPRAGEVLTDAMPTLRGTGEVGAVIELSIDGRSVGTVNVDGSGSWSFPLRMPLGGGMHGVRAVASDPAGNRAEVSHDFTVRSEVPLLLIVNVPDGAFTRDPSPPIHGMAPPGAHVLVSFDGVQLPVVTASARGSWELLLIDPLRPGMHTIEASTVVAGVLLEDRNEFTYVEDTTPVTLTTPAAGSVTADATPTVTGVSSPGARVRISVDGAQMPVGEVTAGSDGSFSFDLPAPLADGRHRVRVDASDGATHPGSAETAFSVDVSTSVDIRLPVAGGVVSMPRPFVSGMAEPQTILVLTLDGMRVAEVDVAIDGIWSVQLVSDLTPGMHTVRASVTDPLGNTAQDEQSFSYDATGPGDRDGDGRADAEECASSPCPDTDGDGNGDDLDPDDDGDGIPTAVECMSAPCPDGDGDGRPDYLDADDDGDGRPTREELGMDGRPRDTDRDGRPDHLDPDDDGDGFTTIVECTRVPCEDTDSDGTPDYLDPDDDTDGVPTDREKVDSERASDDDFDRDGVVNWHDPDSNGNGADDGSDGVGDRDGDQTPDYLDTDTPREPPVTSIIDYSIVGGGGCALSGGRDGGWLLLLLGLLWRRRRPFGR